MFCLEADTRLARFVDNAHNIDFVCQEMVKGKSKGGGGEGYETKGGHLFMQNIFLTIRKQLDKICKYEHKIRI